MSDGERLKIGMEHAPLLDKLHAVLGREDNPVNQQVAIEMLMAGHAARARNIDDAYFIVDAMAKHAKQFLDSIASHGLMPGATPKRE